MLTMLTMDDNPHPHRGSTAVTEFLADEFAQRMVWPANLPDLNPIEHFWALSIVEYTEYSSG
jgi:transposase